MKNLKEENVWRHKKSLKAREEKREGGEGERERD